MANTYYNRVFNPLPGQRVDEQVLKDEFQRVQTGFDGVATKTGQIDADLAGKANLTGGNAFSGDQAVAGSVSATGALTVGGTVTASTPLALGDNSQKLASTNWVQAYVSSITGVQLGLPVAPVQAVPLGLYVVGGVYQWAYTQVPRFAYADRGQLRTFASRDGAAAVVNGLGMFVFVAGSVEPDDDETCFAGTGGRWLLEALHADAMWSMLAPQLDLLSQPIRLTGSANCQVTSVNASQSVSFVAPCDGAEVGDRVAVAPPTSLTLNPLLSFYGAVTQPGLVTIYLVNASASNATSQVGPSTWGFSVLKDF